MTVRTISAEMMRTVLTSIILFVTFKPQSLHRHPFKTLSTSLVSIFECIGHCFNSIPFLTGCCCGTNVNCNNGVCSVSCSGNNNINNNHNNKKLSVTLRITTGSCKCQEGFMADVDKLGKLQCIR